MASANEYHGNRNMPMAECSFTNPSGGIMSTITDYFEQFALVSLEKQEKLSRVIGDHLSYLDINEGMVRCNDDLVFPFQVLGTQSDNTLTLLWAWAEEQTEIPESITDVALKLRDWGMQAGLREFTIPSVDVNRVDGYIIALIATEVCKASCFYRDHYEGGAAFVLLFDRRIDAQPAFDRMGLTRTFQDLIAQYEFNHRNALLSYLRMKNLPFSEDGGIINFKLESGEDLQMDFDENGALRSVNGEPGIA